ncbi:molybdenum cofactor synthesis domain protein [Burkholderiales bacterium GJ-E10]|nr:molybdenum cofactor synthesis domain protein [Burkholderiales bacterium GJ-E10]
MSPGNPLQDRRERPDLAPEDALRIILDGCSPLPTSDCSLAAGVGRVLAAPIISTVALPPFDNAAMDGFALGGTAAPLAAGAEIPLEGRQAAGDGPSCAQGGAWEIMTGARLPDGLDRVVPFERAELLEEPPRIRLLADVTARQNVRGAGSDVRPGETVLEAATVLAPRHLMLLAALGFARMPVIERPRVAILCTGKELIDDSSRTLATGQIRDANGPFLAACIPLAGAEMAYAQTVTDDSEAFCTALQRAQDARAHVVVSTGAVSMGRYDFVPETLERFGACIAFHKIAIRPGKPLLFARLPEGALFFGLPGNPMAAAVGWRFFVEPALRAMLRLPLERPRRLPLHAAFRKEAPLRFHLKSRVRPDAEDRVAVHILSGQESYRIRSIAQADAWTVIAAETDFLPAGAMVDVYGMSHLETSTAWGNAV